MPVYLVIDPYTAKWAAHSVPKDGEYTHEVRSAFGDPVDLAGTPVGLVLETGDFAPE